MVAVGVRQLKNQLTRYLRLAEKSEFVLVDNSLDNLLVRINKGSAIIEATGTDRIELHVPIVTAQRRMTIVRAGVYRINVTPGTTELFVRKGRVSLSGNNTDLDASAAAKRYSPERGSAKVRPAQLSLPNRQPAIGNSSNLSHASPARSGCVKLWRKGERGEEGGSLSFRAKRGISP